MHVGEMTNGENDSMGMGIEVLVLPAMKRRNTGGAAAAHYKQNFACTVPGCGTTFMQKFNLKEHLHSHFDQKPYKCHWPGCRKGYARECDCKQHEQLHSNVWLLECEGCRKQFDWMDTLFWHLKSEAGAECLRVV